MPRANGRLMPEEYARTLAEFCQKTEAVVGADDSFEAVLILAATMAAQLRVSPGRMAKRLRARAAGLKVAAAIARANKGRIVVPTDSRLFH